ncbi:SMP-30/gluconolactonase/LRE family protein [Neogemmobacter tilapiae]|uniref:Gluconolactonase n=1 Tax=Neogemmobacter tilapiae TaxID=875041 RepID=A0A918WKU9_9RHOB|nr:SMP-30/gluconolactonase/LRE family protein [Gemmobacter tilapiae]GHC52148.1 gluconolactonase [Gemmobacter tilapiae]
MIYDNRLCQLGEGALWHPEREQFFWVDILGRKLMTQVAGQPQAWDMGEMCSAMGWISRDEFLIASETALFRFNIETGARVDLMALEADKPENRSNDGRADPWGGFWIGTMGRRAAADVGFGSFYRLYKGELRKVFPNVTIPNSCSFTPDGKTMFFADSALYKVFRVALDAEGWPVGQPETFLDFSASQAEPDGAVVDQDGLFWVALWADARVAAFAHDGAQVHNIPIPASQCTCPAFGGADGKTLFVTSAREWMSYEGLAQYPQSGATFAFPGVAMGQKEHRVIL